MHGNLGYLFAGFAATWVALFGYIFYIQRRLGETRNRLQWIEEESPRSPAEHAGSSESP